MKGVFTNILILILLKFSQLRLRLELRFSFYLLGKTVIYTIDSIVG